MSYECLAKLRSKLVPSDFSFLILRMKICIENCTKIFANFLSLSTSCMQNISKICEQFFSFLFFFFNSNSMPATLDLFPSFPENSTERCTYPSWVVDNKLWLALDPVASRLLASPYNLTILNRQETRLVCHSVVPINDRHYHPDRENQVQYVAKATLDW